MCTSPSATFIWVGAILVNFGFISLIYWSAETLWPLGFILCGAYTILLFRLARWLQTREEEIVSESLEQNEDGFVETRSNEGSRLVDSMEDTLATGGTRRSMHTQQHVETVSLPVSLLYGLAIVSMGVTGFFIPANVFDNCGGPYMPQYTWTTNISSLPEGVQKWAVGKEKEAACNSFAFLVDTHTTFFSASTSCDFDAIGLWSVNGTAAPKSHKDHKYPDNFIALSNRTVCFDSVIPSNNIERVIHCADEAGIYPSTPPPEGRVNPNTFFPFNNTLWFKAAAGQPTEAGDIIYSLDPDSMNISLYSYKEHSSDNNGKGGCDYYKALQKQAITTFFVTAVPVTCASIAIWKLYQIPSMATTTYAGLTAMFVTLYVASNPHMESERPFEWWFTITGLFWILIMSYFHLLPSTSQAKKAPLRWGLVIGGLAFYNTWTVLPMEKDRLMDWILLNLLLFVPLIILGAANKNGFLQFLGAVGFLVDAGRFAEFVGTHVKGQAQMPVQFLVFSFTGMMAGFFGFKVNQYQDQVKEWATAVVQQINEVLSNLASRDVPGPSIESEHGATVPLTENQEARMEEAQEAENA